MDLGYEDLYKSRAVKRGGHTFIVTPEIDDLTGDPTTGGRGYGKITVLLENDEKYEGDVETPTDRPFVMLACRDHNDADEWFVQSQILDEVQGGGEITLNAGFWTPDDDLVFPESPARVADDLTEDNIDVTVRHMPMEEFLQAKAAEACAAYNAWHHAQLMKLTVEAVKPARDGMGIDVEDPDTYEVLLSDLTAGIPTLEALNQEAEDAFEGLAEQMRPRARKQA